MLPSVPLVLQDACFKQGAQSHPVFTEHCCGFLLATGCLQGQGKIVQCPVGKFLAMLPFLT